MNDYLKNLPRKRMASGVLIFNEKDELLIVKISYKDYWSIPGGVVEENESPRQACIREVKEEIGLELHDPKFICVDYTKADSNKNKDESLQFMFYGGILKEEEMKSIKVDGEEIIEYNFVSLEKVNELLGGDSRSLVKRLSACIKALREGKGIYLEDGV